MRPLVLVHGFMGGSDQWHLQREALASDRTLITPDLPGFGNNNQATAPDTIEDFAHFVLDHLLEQGVAEFDLLGHSMGGMIVQEMVAHAPERVKRLILYGTASTGNLPGRFETFTQSRQRVIDDGAVVTANRISATWFADYENAPEFENCAAVARRSNIQSIQASLTAMENWLRTSDLESISCPTLIIWGELDRTYRWPQIEELWTAISGASLAVLPGCAHAAHMEKPEFFNSIVVDFLADSQKSEF